MNGFKRFCLIVFSLAGLLTLTALALPWVGPWTAQAKGLLANGIYFTALEVLFCITALGLVVLLFRAILARKNKKNILVTSVDGGQITVSRDAIASQAAHIIEEDGTFTAVRVDVDARKRSKIKVHARVLPTSRRRETNCTSASPRGSQPSAATTSPRSASSSRSPRRSPPR